MNIPNILSVIRICLVPVFILVYFGDSPNSNIGAAIVYAVASITDVLDGRINTILPPISDVYLTRWVISL